MSGLAGAGISSICRLCVTCGLHRIPTSVWQPPKQVNFVKSLTLRASVYALCAPETPDELAARILTLWVVTCRAAAVSLIPSWVAYVMDVCASVSYQYDPVFRLEDITTPLPRPFDHYRLVSPADPEPHSRLHHRGWSRSRTTLRSFPTCATRRRLDAVTIHSQ